MRLFCRKHQLSNQESVFINHVIMTLLQHLASLDMVKLTSFSHNNYLYWLLLQFAGGTFVRCCCTEQYIITFMTPFPLPQPDCLRIPATALTPHCVFCREIVVAVNIYNNLDKNIFKCKAHANNDYFLSLLLLWDEQKVNILRIRFTH